MKRIILCLTFFLALLQTGAACAAAPAFSWETAHKGTPLDLSDVRISFEDNFLTPSVTDKDGAGPWFAPIHGGFGGAKFLPPTGAGNPFSFSSGYLSIRLSKKSGRWTSGLMQSVNHEGEGFAQRYGYFEMRALLPRGLGTWSAFWLKTLNQYTAPQETRGELDVIEAYGGDLYGHHAALHLWPGKSPAPDTLQKHWQKGQYTKLPHLISDGMFHTYGVKVTPENIILYYDRKELARTKTPDVFKAPLFLLVDLAYNAEEGRKDNSDAILLLDYVRVWQFSSFKD